MGSSLPESRPERTGLERMLEARSVAVVGASSREGSFGERMMIELVDGGFEGDVYPVNPRYEEVRGFRCYGSVAELPGPVDLVVLGVSNALLEEQLQLAAKAGAGSAAIFASGYEDPHGDMPPLTERLARIARDAGMAICGGNGMGFVHVERGLRACGFYEPKDLEPGPITLVTHSGSVFSTLLQNDRGLKFNLAVSSGQEIVTTAADYLRYALERESTRAIGLFIETVRDVPGFRVALERAVHRDVPVVALKIGRSEHAREMVTAHSGALAGEDGAYEALFDAYGVLRVASLDELADTLELFVAGRRAAKGGFAALLDSGGERAMMIDAAADAGVPFADISERTRERLAAVLEPGLPPVNPLDAWGTGNDPDVIYEESMRALCDDPDTGVFAFAVDLTTEDDASMGYIDMGTHVFPRTDKPFAFLANFSSGADAAEAKRARAAGIPVLEGTLTGLAAIRHLLEYRDFRAREPVAAPGLPPDDVRERWRKRLSGGEPLSEVEGLALVADYGVSVVDALPASSETDAARQAQRIGWPVVLKTAVPGVRHKSDAGGVILGVGGPVEMKKAYRRLADRLGPEVVVARTAPPGVELALGVVRDPQFGPLVLVAAGGILVELLHDRRLAFPPVDEAGARRLVDRLAVRPMLDGVRGAPASDVDSVVDAIVALSALAADLGEYLDALDVNPIIAGPDGCVAVDALVVPRAPDGSGSG